MNNDIEKEILRLVKEIAEDEKSIIRNEKLDNEKGIKRYKDSVERKIKVLELLKK